MSALVGSGSFQKEAYPTEAAETEVSQGLDMSNGMAM